MWAAAFKSVSHPSIVREVLCARPVNEILPLGTYTSPQELTDQNETQTCLLNVIRISECSLLQGNTGLTSLSFLFRLSHPFTARHTADLAVCSLT